MKRRDTMTISEFMEKDSHKSTKKLEVKDALVISGLTISSMVIGADVVNASTGIDKAAGNAYEKLLDVGKWIIIIKGGIDSINNVVQGDFDTAKKSFFGYLVVYLILNALPWAFEQVDQVFKTI